MPVNSTQIEFLNGTYIFASRDVTNRYGAVNVHERYTLRNGWGEDVWFFFFITKKKTSGRQTPEEYYCSLLLSWAIRKFQRGRKVSSVRVQRDQLRCIGSDGGAVNEKIERRIRV